MPLIMKNLHDEKRYALLLRNRQTSLSESEATVPVGRAKKRPLAPRLAPPKKSVKFTEFVEVQEHTTLDEYSDEEYVRSWYSRKELKQIKGTLCVTVRMMVAGDLEQDTEEHCARGLEIRTSAGCEKRRLNKRKGWEAVLNEQARQYNRCVNDSEAIASAFIQANVACRKVALMNGLRDELEVLKINDRPVTPKVVSDAINTSSKNTSTNNNMNTNRRNLSKGNSLRNFLKRTVSIRREQLLQEIKENCTKGRKN